jgi:prepilin-type processing-associated H-X9-DG protein
MGLCGCGAGGPTAEQASLANLEEIALAVQAFLADNQDTMPDVTVTSEAMTVLEAYVKTRDVFWRPETDEMYMLNPDLAGVHLVNVGDPALVAVFYEASPASDGSVGVAFLDGHVARLSAADWQKTKTISGIQ